MSRKSIPYRTRDGLLVTRGNKKLGVDTLAINTGPALSCPSYLAGLCNITRFCPNAMCYAQRDEIQYPETLLFRFKQEMYWYEHEDDPRALVKDFDWLLNHMRVKINWLRFCVSGDLFTHKDWAAMDVLSHYLRHRWDIGTYGYSAVPTHPYKGLNFVVRGSGHNSSPFGHTIVIPQNAPRPHGYYMCPMDCSICHACKQPTFRNIAFRVHAIRKTGEHYASRKNQK